jgi:hypothetical protein
MDGDGGARPVPVSRVGWNTAQIDRCSGQQRPGRQDRAELDRQSAGGRGAGACRQLRGARDVRPGRGDPSAQRQRDNRGQRAAQGRPGSMDELSHRPF